MLLFLIYTIVVITKIIINVVIVLLIIPLITPSMTVTYLLLNIIKICDYTKLVCVIEMIKNNFMIDLIVKNGGKSL